MTGENSNQTIKKQTRLATHLPGCFATPADASRSPSGGQFPTSPVACGMIRISRDQKSSTIFLKKIKSFLFRQAIRSGRGPQTKPGRASAGGWRKIGRALRRLSQPGKIARCCRPKGALIPSANGACPATGMPTRLSQRAEKRRF